MQRSCKELEEQRIRVEKRRCIAVAYSKKISEELREQGCRAVA